MPDYMQARAQEEETLDMFQLGLDARRKLRGPWFVQAGIQYVQWTDVRRIDRETVSSRLDSNLLLSRIIYPDGSIEEIYDAGIVTVVQTATEERYNRYRHIELPVMVGAAIPVGQRWRIDVSAGLAFGLYSRPSGTATIGTATKTLNTLGYRNAGAISGQTQLAWMYNNPNWSAGLLLTGRSGLTQSTRTNAAFTEKRHALGLGIVLRRTIR
ncbi:MAG: hypothetical protein IPK76_03455 [Lewinellaceae bacterium]|nr:hypothetical protein [Lewinellaceae bacterium]